MRWNSTNSYTLLFTTISALTFRNDNGMGARFPFPYLSLLPHPFLLSSFSLLFFNSPPLSYFPPLSTSRPILSLPLLLSIHLLVKSRGFGEHCNSVSLSSGTQNVSQLIELYCKSSKGLNQTCACKNRLILLFQKIYITKFPWGDLAASSPQLFGRVGDRPHRSHRVGAYAYH